MKIVMSSLAASLVTICFAASAQDAELHGTWQCNSRHTGTLWKVEVDQTATYAMNGLFRAETVIDFDFSDTRNDISYVLKGTGDYYLSEDNLCTRFQDLAVTATNLSAHGTLTDDELQAEADWYKSEVLKSDLCSARIVDITAFRMTLESSNGLKIVCAKEGDLS